MICYCDRGNNGLPRMISPIASRLSSLCSLKGEIISCQNDDMHFLVLLQNLVNRLSLTMGLAVRDLETIRINPF